MTVGQIAPGDALGTQMNVSGNVSLAAGAVLDYQLDTPSTSDMLVCGSMSLNGQQFSAFDFTPTANFGPGSSYDLIAFGSSSGNLGTTTSGTIDGLPATLSLQSNELVLTVVPEPGTLALLGIATAGLIGGAAARQARQRAGRLSSGTRKPGQHANSLFHAAVYGKPQRRCPRGLSGLVALVIIAVSAAARADITYDLYDYPDLENGYTLSGTITTDGAMGVLSPTDITNWDVNISQNSKLLVHADPSTGFIQNCNNLNADATGLWLATSPGVNRFNVVDGVPRNDSVVIQYSFVPSLDEDEYLGQWPGHGGLWNDTNGSGFQPAGDFIIATPTVPEPSSIALLLAGAVALVAIAWRRRLVA